MTAAAFAFILLSAAYLWLRRWQLSRSHLLRADGQALYFLVVAAAVPVGLWVGSLLQGISHLASHPDWPAALANAYLSGVLTEEKNRSQVLLFGIVAVLSVPGALVYAWLLNLPIGRNGASTARLLLRFGSPSEVERFLWGVNESGLSVMATTASGKVYVGNSVELPLAGHEREFVRLEPLLSGYRDDNQEFKPTTSYAWIATLPPVGGQGVLCKRDFDVLLPVETLTSLHSFDLATYVSRYHKSATRAVVPSKAKLKVSVPQASAAVQSRPNSVIRRAEYFYLTYVIFLTVLPGALALGLNWGVCLAGLAVAGICAIAAAIESF